MSDPWDGAEESADFLCRHCGTHTRGRVLRVHWFTADAGAFGGLDLRYRLLECTRCHDLTLMLAQDQWGSREYADESAVYPTPPRSLGSPVPEALRTCFGEARVCLASRAYTASAIMYRRSLELLAVDRGIRARNLAAALTALRDQREIDDRLYSWADELRLAGNQAAHDVQQVSAADAQDINDIAEAIIDYVYVFQARYEAFKQRRAEPPPPADSEDEGDPDPPF